MSENKVNEVKKIDFSGKEKIVKIEEKEIPMEIKWRCPNIECGRLNDMDNKICEVCKSPRRERNRL